ncbi:hypothetical protein ACZ90_40820 [Streptomyces albus subsp. albus]|nr:hypothetical protein ACZ90_40820 [Streptomyces albus subsp. albus]
MIYAVWAPLLVPFFAVPVAGRVAEAFRPRTAAWLLTAYAAVLALSTATALSLLFASGALSLRPVAALGHLRIPLVGDGLASSPAVAGLALLLLGTGATTAARRLRRQARELAEARRYTNTHTGGDLSVMADSRPDAFALPGRPGRIVVTAGMLRALEPAEREVLFAHERAHLAGRHHLFLRVTDIAAAWHPMLRLLRAPLVFALERWADESAARAVGDRALTARAIGRAALATRQAGPSDAGHRRPDIAIAATAGPVPRRVAALLGRDQPAVPRSQAGRHLVTGAIALCLAFSVGSTADAATDLHGSIEVAQGEYRQA